MTNLEILQALDYMINLPPNKFGDSLAKWINYHKIIGNVLLHDFDSAVIAIDSRMVAIGWGEGGKHLFHTEKKNFLAFDEAGLGTLLLLPPEVFHNENCSIFFYEKVGKITNDLRLYKDEIGEKFGDNFSDLVMFHLSIRHAWPVVAEIEGQKQLMLFGRRWE